MACHLYGAKLLSEPMLTYCQLNADEHISVKFYSNFKFSFKKMLSVCKMVAILSKGKWVKEKLFWTEVAPVEHQAKMSENIILFV